MKLLTLLKYIVVCVVVTGVVVLLVIAVALAVCFYVHGLPVL